MTAQTVKDYMVKDKDFVVACKDTTLPAQIPGSDTFTIKMREAWSRYFEDLEAIDIKILQKLNEFLSDTSDPAPVNVVKRALSREIHALNIVVSYTNFLLIDTSLSTTSRRALRTLRRTMELERDSNQEIIDELTPPV